jgi:putative membrane protein
MKRIIFRFLINLVALYIVKILGFVEIKDFKSAISAILILAIFNTFLRPILRILTFPLHILTFGLFSFLINAFILLITAKFVPGFEIEKPIYALIASVLLSIVGSLLGYFLK